jgi:hypothetical protein
VADRHGPAVRAADLDRLAGHRPHRVKLAVGRRDLLQRVGHPRHDAGVGAEIGRHHVLVGPEVMPDRDGEPPRDPHEFRLGKFGRAAPDAAHRPAETHPGERRRQRAQRGEGLGLVERDPRVESHAAEERPEGVVVLDAVALEEPMPAVVHEHREVHHDLARGLGENDPLVMRQADELGRLQEPGERGVEGIGRIVDEPEFLEDRLADRTAGVRDAAVGHRAG